MIKVKFLTHSLLIDKKFCREHGVAVEYGIPADQETIRIAKFNVQCRVPSEEELIELLMYWKEW